MVHNSLPASRLLSINLLDKGHESSAEAGGKVRVPGGGIRNSELQTV